MLKKQEFTSYTDFVQNYKLEVPENFNFSYDILDKLAEENPDRLAMIHVDPEDNRHEYTFGFFREQSARLANALTERGAKKGDRVMLILYRRVEFWVAMLALHRIGAVGIPSPSLLTEKDICERVNYAGVTGIICEDSIVDRVEQAKGGCKTLEHFLQVGKAPLKPGWSLWEDVVREGYTDFSKPDNVPGGDDPLLIFFSSGTTGMPKMVLHNHKYPYSHYTTAAYWHDLEPSDIHLTVSDSGWGKCVWGKFYGQWMAGAVVFVWDFRGKFEPGELLQKISDNEITSFCAPPTVYRFLVREDLQGYNLSSLRHCTTAGELLNDSVFYAWKENVGLPIFEGYGQTETTLQVATFKFMEPKPSSIGKPVPGWDISLLGEDGKPVPKGEEGEICIKLHSDGGDNEVVGLFDSYMDEPEKTAGAKVNGFYHTGDKVWEDEEGYFWFMGRTDDLIKSSGYRIGPFEVESALVSHDAVVEAAVTGVPDPVRGQAVKATVVLGENHEPSDFLTKELQNHVKSVTAPYKYPRVIEYVKELPKTISGKIKRAEIRDADKDRY